MHEIFYTSVLQACKKSLIDKNKNSISAELKVSSFNMEMMHSNPESNNSDPRFFTDIDALFLTRFDWFMAQLLYYQKMTILMLEMR